MRPIVDGIRAENDTLDVIEMNAQDGGVGTEAFKAYGLRGHPALVVVSADGDVLWQQVGVVAADEVQRQIRLALGESP